MVYLAAVLLALYNVLFFTERHAPDFLPGITNPFASFHDQFTGFLIVLELIGVASIFVDLISSYEKRPKGLLRSLWTLLVAVLTIGFLFKLFIVYLDSSVLGE